MANITLKGKDLQEMDSNHDQKDLQEMDSNHDQKPLHALVIPYPGQGHINPMMHFSKILASKGFIVTFVTTHYRDFQINEANANVTEGYRSLGFNIRSAKISDGLPFDFDRSAKFYDFMRSVDNMGKELEELLNNLSKTAKPPISCVIADTFLPWSLDVTKKFGIPWISFWTQPAVVYSIYYHMHLLVSAGHFPSKGPVQWQDRIDYIPGVPSICPIDLPSFLQATDTTDYVLDLLIRSFESVRGADWVLGNSFDELESQAVDAMRIESAPILLVGPVLPPGSFDSRSTELDPLDLPVGTSLWTESDCTPWLDTKPNKSVIYVSFGSLVHLSRPQIQEIAMGLKESEQPFLWVLRSDIIASHVSNYLPDGFVEEVKNQGLIISWSSQLRVLSHPSVGGFFTHCGWNSVLESIAMGIPMIGFPLWTEQYTNCKLMAEEWKIGLRLRGGHGDERVIERKEISSAVIKLIVEEEGKQMMDRVNKLKDVARKASRKGGSSDNNINTFIDGLKLRIQIQQREEENR